MAEETFEDMWREFEDSIAEGMEADYFIPEMQKSAIRAVFDAGGAAMLCLMVSGAKPEKLLSELEAPKETTEH